MSNKRSKNRQSFRNWAGSKAGKKYRLILYFKQWFRCKRCKCFMYLPNRWFHDTDRMASFEHMIDLEFIKLVKDKRNLILLCRRCNNLKGHAKQISSPFIKLFDKDYGQT